MIIIIRYIPLIPHDLSDKDHIQITSFDGSSLKWPNGELKFLVRAQQKACAGAMETMKVSPGNKVLLDVSEVEERF